MGGVSQGRAEFSSDALRLTGKFLLKIMVDLYKLEPELILVRQG